MAIRKITEVSSPGEIHIKDPWFDNQYEEWKFNLHGTEPGDGPFVRELDFDSTHRQWNGDEYHWYFDLSSLFVVIAHFISGGFDVTFDDEVLEAYGTHSANEQTSNNSQQVTS